MLGTSYRRLQISATEKVETAEVGQYEAFPTNRATNPPTHTLEQLSFQASQQRIHSII